MGPYGEGGNLMFSFDSGEGTVDDPEAMHVLHVNDKH
jgi:hypothetical protein